MICLLSKYFCYFCGGVEINFNHIKINFNESESIKQTKRQRITNDCKQKALIHIPLYVKSTPDLQYRKNFETYISQEHWENPIITNPQKIPNNEHGRLEAAFNAKGTYDSTI